MNISKVVEQNLIILAVIIVLITIMYFGLSVRKKRKDMENRIQRIKDRGIQRPVEAVMSDGVSLRRQRKEIKGLAYWLTKPLPKFDKIEARLERVGKHITAKQYMLRRIVWMIIITAVIAIAFQKSLLISAAAGFILGIWLPLKLLKRAITKQDKAFLKLFPDALDLIVRGLRSGLPVSESLQVVSSELPEPLGPVFAEVSNTMKLGVPLEKALHEAADKLDLTEFNFFVTSIVLQRETGGNLAEVLNNLSEVLRSRFLMRMKIMAMSSEARASAVIIGALPFVVFILVSVVSPGYMSVLYTDPRGNVAAIIALAMLSFGIWVMRRMTQFEI